MYFNWQTDIIEKNAFKITHIVQRLNAQFKDKGKENMFLYVAGFQGITGPW